MKDVIHYWLNLQTMRVIPTDHVLDTHTHVIEFSSFEELRNENENLKMVCRRLSAAKKLETRDNIAKQCHHLFTGSPLRNAEDQAYEEIGEALGYGRRRRTE